MERVYLDHNATTPLRDEARAAMVAAMDVAGNPSSVHAEGRAAKALVEKARAQIAAALGAEGADIVFTSGATEAAALALDRARLVGPGESAPPGFALRGAIPREGLSGLFAASGRALARLGAQIELGVLVSPREASLDREPDEVIVWAADPTPLFDLAALRRPAAVAERVASYVFRADIAAPRPLNGRCHRVRPLCNQHRDRL